MSEDQTKAMNTPSELAMTNEHSWGELISPERQAELQAMIEKWEATQRENSDVSGPFADVALTGADVFWLAIRDRKLSGVPMSDIEGVAEDEIRAGRSVISHLPPPSLHNLNLNRASLVKAHLAGAYLRNVRLIGATLYGADLRHSDLSGAHLEGAELGEAQLVESDLSGAWLPEANLSGAHLEATSLYEAHLGAAYLNSACLAGADLRLAYLDAATALNNISLYDSLHGSVRLADIRWGGANVTVVDWEDFTELGDTHVARAGRPKFAGGPGGKAQTAHVRAMRTGVLKSLAVWIDAQEAIAGTPSHTMARGKRQDVSPQAQDSNRKLEQRAERLSTFRAAVRANRQLAVVLQTQGLEEDASRFAYQAQVLQRRVLRLQGIKKLGPYLFSLLLSWLAGYGYRLRRILFAYSLIVTVFAASYFFSGHTLSSAPPTSAGIMQGILDAFQISLNAIHGRVFFVQFGLDTTQSWLATFESITGIVIEGAFVAMLIQRFFGR